MLSHVPNKWMLIILSIMGVILTSCTPPIEKIPQTGYLRNPLQAWDEPFTGIWASPKATQFETKTNKIYISPVSLSFIDPPSSSESERREQEKLANYFRNKLISDIQKDPNGIVLVDTPKGSEITLDLAFLRVKPTNHILNILSLGTTSYIPGIDYITGPISKGETVLAGKIINSRTGEVLAEFADLRNDKSSLFGSLRDYTAYGHTYQTLDMWAEKIKEILQLKVNQKVKAPIWLGINPF